uniref:F-box associated domain-containing protein n=1 Tax=Aegilops tauschii TaxID=37682 RepID=N1QWL0_AEGTA
MQGKVWKTNRVPSGGLTCGRIGLSQGCLHYSSIPRVKKKKENTKVASVWFMEDYDSKEWVLKHSVSNGELRNINGVDYKVAAFHPDCDTIFPEARRTLPRTLRKWELHAPCCPCDVDALASYDMQHQKFHRILNLGKNKTSNYLPYVPLFSDSLAVRVRNGPGLAV